MIRNNSRLVPYQCEYISHPLTPLIASRRNLRGLRFRVGRLETSGSVRLGRADRWGPGWSGRWMRWRDRRGHSRPPRPLTLRDDDRPTRQACGRAQAMSRPSSTPASRIPTTPSHTPTRPSGERASRAQGWRSAPVVDPLQCPSPPQPDRMRRRSDRARAPRSQPAAGPSPSERGSSSRHQVDYKGDVRPLDGTRGGALIWSDTGQAGAPRAGS